MSPDGRRPTDEDYDDLFADEPIDEFDDLGDPQRASGVRRHLEAGHVRRAAMIKDSSASLDDEIIGFGSDDESRDRTRHPSADGHGHGGRLYRSVNAPSGPDTEPALGREDVSRLRTIHVTERPMVYVSDFEDHRRDEEDEPVVGRRGRRDGARAGRERREEVAIDAWDMDRARPGLRPLTGYLLVIGLTLITAVAERLLEGPGWSSGLWLTGVALLVSSVYVACTVGRGDFLVAVCAPPIAALVVALTVGQIGAVSAGGFLATHALALFNALGASALGGGTSWNWAWILGTTLLTSIIVVIRALVGRRD